MKKFRLYKSHKHNIAFVDPNFSSSFKVPASIDDIKFIFISEYL